MVLMNKEELLMHKTANCLGCSNCEIVVQVLKKERKEKSRLKTLDSLQYTELGLDQGMVSRMTWEATKESMTASHLPELSSLSTKQAFPT